jgi:hypothetical protein
MDVGLAVVWGKLIYYRVLTPNRVLDFAALKPMELAWEARSIVLRVYLSQFLTIGSLGGGGRDEEAGGDKDSWKDRKNVMETRI